MNLRALPLAVETLHKAILALTPVDVAMASVLEQYDVTERAVRARFENHYRLTPEELAQRHPEDKTIGGFIDQFLKANSHRHPSRLKHTGKRFFVYVDDKSCFDNKRWYRFLIEHGKMITAADELTHQVAEIYGSELIDDIARQIGWKRWRHWSESEPRLSRQQRP